MFNMGLGVALLVLGASYIIRTLSALVVGYGGEFFFGYDGVILNGVVGVISILFGAGLFTKRFNTGIGIALFVLSALFTLALSAGSGEFVGVSFYATAIFALLSGGGFIAKKFNRERGIGIASLVLGALCILFAPVAFAVYEDFGVLFFTIGIASILSGVATLTQKFKIGFGVVLLVLGAFCITVAAAIAGERNAEKITFVIASALVTIGIPSILSGVGIIFQKINTGLGVLLVVLGTLCIVGILLSTNIFFVIPLVFAMILSGVGFYAKKFNLDRKVPLVIGIAVLVLGALCIVVPAAFITGYSPYEGMYVSGAPSLLEVVLILTGIGFIKSK